MGKRWSKCDRHVGPGQYCEKKARVSVHFEESVEGRPIEIWNALCWQHYVDIENRARADSNLVILSAKILE